MAPVAHCRARAATGKDGAVPMQARRQPLATTATAALYVGESDRPPPRPPEAIRAIQMSPKRWLGRGGVRETEAITRWSAADLGTWARSSSRHQNLREGSALEALLFDDVELQVLIEIGEWAAARTDRNRNRR